MGLATGMVKLNRLPLLGALSTEEVQHRDSGECYPATRVGRPL